MDIEICKFSKENTSFKMLYMLYIFISLLFGIIKNNN